MSDELDMDPETPAEQRLLAYLEGLRDHPPQASGDLVAAVVRTARWQAVARPYLSALGTIAGALGAGVSMLMGTRGRR